MKNLFLNPVLFPWEYSDSLSVEQNYAHRTIWAIMILSFGMIVLGECLGWANSTYKKKNKRTKAILIVVLSISVFICICITAYGVWNISPDELPFVYDGTNVAS